MSEKNLKQSHDPGPAAKRNNRLGSGTPVSKVTSEELVITRVFDSPRDTVFQAWTEADRLARWWGPKGFTMLSCTVDLRPGGVFHYGMRSPDGMEMWGKFVYREIVAPERLAFVISFSDKNAGTTRHPFSATWPLEVLNTATFETQGKKTLVTLRGTAVNASDIERKTFVDNFKSLEQGFKGTLDQLEAYLAETNGAPTPANITRSEIVGREFILRRTFDASRDLVFAMWTDPKLLSKWWGPRVMSVPFAAMDVRPGGAYRIVMRGPDGVEYPMHGTYREVKRPERISFSCILNEHPASWFELLDSQLGGSPRAATLEMLITVTFSEVNGSTEVAVHTLFESQSVRDAMAKMGMKDGWSESFGRLEDLLTAKR